MYTLPYYQKDLQVLITDVKTVFWKLEDCNFDEETKNYISFENLFVTYSRYQVIRCTPLVVFMFIRKAAMQGELPFKLWLPEDHSGLIYVMLYVAGASTLMSNIFLVGGHDVLFSAQCCKVAVQYKMLVMFWKMCKQNMLIRLLSQSVLVTTTSCLGKRNISVNLITYATGYLIKV